MGLQTLTAKRLQRVGGELAVVREGRRAGCGQPRRRPPVQDAHRMARGECAYRRTRSSDSAIRQKLRVTTYPRWPPSRTFLEPILLQVGAGVVRRPRSATSRATITSSTASRSGGSGARRHMGHGLSPTDDDAEPVALRSPDDAPCAASRSPRRRFRSGAAAAAGAGCGGRRDRRAGQPGVAAAVDALGRPGAAHPAGSPGDAAAARERMAAWRRRDARDLHRRRPGGSDRPAPSDRA